MWDAAAGYGYECKRYEKRLTGLLAYFEACQLPADVVSRFWVLGGECNYLFKCDANAKLYSVPEQQWHHEQEAHEETTEEYLEATKESC